MKENRALQVGIRELKNQLSWYLRLVKRDQELIITERGKPIAVIQPVAGVEQGKSLEARLAALAAKGFLTLPRKPPGALRMPRVKLKGRPLSEEIIAERR